MAGNWYLWLRWSGTKKNKREGHQPLAPWPFYNVVVVVVGRWETRCLPSGRGEHFYSARALPWPPGLHFERDAAHSPGRPLSVGQARRKSHVHGQQQDSETNLSFTLCCRLTGAVISHGRQWFRCRASFAIPWWTRTSSGAPRYGRTMSSICAPSATWCMPVD